MNPNGDAEVQPCQQTHARGTTHYHVLRPRPGSPSTGDALSAAIYAALNVLAAYGFDKHEPFCVPARQCTCHRLIYRDIAALVSPSTGDSAAAPSPDAPRPSVTWHPQERTVIALMAPIGEDGNCTGCGTKPSRATGSCRCLFRVDEVIRAGVSPSTGHPDDAFVVAAQRYRKEHDATHGEAEQCGGPCIVLGLTDDD
jgi:hypothetical protein